MGSNAVRDEAAIEAVVREVWVEVLNVEPIPPEAHFFDLGGHSLLAIRVMSRIQARLGVDLPLAALFQHPTLRAFAAEVGDALGWVMPPAADAPTPPVAPPAPADSTDLDELLAALDDLSDDEAAALLERLESNSQLES